MKVSLNWLTDYVEVAMPAKELAEVLTRVGLKCEDIIETGNDVVLDVEVTANRPDCLGHIGLAREVAAATGAEFRPPRIGDLPTAGPVSKLTSVEVQEPALCPRYTARVIRGVKVAPSPAWMIERLQAVGLRGINNIVDVTNYVLMEYSQPLHSFDFDKLSGRRIVVRRARPGETLVSIDRTTCRLDEEMLVIADAERAVAIAGIMGGLNTEVDENTANVLIEAAQFDPLVTRRTSRKLALMSESNYRFERGVDPVGVDEASLRACQLILQLAGGRLAEGVVDAWAEPWGQRVVTLRPQRCSALLGADVPAERQVELLGRLGLRPVLQDGRILCTIPSYRPDLACEVDLIEEVARLEGYDRIPVAAKLAHVVTSEEPERRFRRRLAEALSAAGFDEALTFTFVDVEEAALFGESNPVRVSPMTRRTNNALRASLLPSLLRVCKTNQDAGNAEVSVYELASVFPPGEASSPLPEERVELAMVTTRGLSELRGALEAVVARLAPEATLEVEPCPRPGLAAEASAELRLAGRPAGAIGVIADNVRDRYGLERPCAVATIRFDELLGLAGQRRLYQPLPKFPAIQRDLSAIVDEAATWRQICAAVAGAAQTSRAAVDYVTSYRGAPVPQGRKSVTLRLTYRSPEGTLRSEEVDALVAEVADALRRELAAEFRA